MLVAPDSTPPNPCACELPSHTLLVLLRPDSPTGKLLAPVFCPRISLCLSLRWGRREVPNGVRALLKSSVDVEMFGNFANAILAWIFSALCVYIHLLAIWKFGGRALRIYCIFYLRCMCIRIAHFGFWNGLVDRQLTYSYLTFFAYVSWGPISKKIIGFPISQKIIGWCARDVASGAASRVSPTLSARSRAVTLEMFQPLRPSHEREF